MVLAGHHFIAGSSNSPDDAVCVRLEIKLEPGGSFKGTPKHAIPVVLLARLAVDLSYQGQKVGEGLLKEALLKILAASSIIGVRAVLVHAKDQKAAAFYAKYGFVSSPLDSFHMMLILKDIAKVVGA